VVAAFDGTGTSLAPTCDLPRGAHFFRARTRGPLGDIGTTTTPVWQLRVAGTNGLPTAIDGVDGDFNGDGLADIAVASPGGIRLVYGRRGAAPAEEAALRSTDVASQLEFVGDINGDGVGDLAAAAGGVVRLFYGRRAGAMPSAPFMIPTPAGSVGFGSSGARPIAAAGDVNEDGDGDLLVGAPDSTRSGLTSAGAAYIVLGGRLSVQVEPVDPSRGSQSDELFGFSVAGAGDLTSDGRPELLVGAPGDAFRSGYLTIYNRASGASPPMFRQQGAAMNAWVGQNPVILADVTGDARSDVATSWNAATGLTPFVLEVGGDGTLRSAPRALGGGALSGVLRGGDATPGDDLVCFVETVPTGVYVVRGGSTLDVSGAASPIRAPAGATMLVGTATTGDMDGDGYADFAQRLTGSALLFVRGGATPSAMGTVALSAQPTALTRGL
jgi:hypothetical protein